MENLSKVEMFEKADKMKVDFVELADIKPNPKLTENLSFSFVKRFQVVPIKLEGERLTVAMVDPSDLYAIEQLEIRTKMTIVPVLANPKEILEHINSLYSELSADDIKIPILEDKEATRIMEMIDDGTREWLLRVLVNALNRGASDIHVEPYEKEIKVRYRIDGVISETVLYPREMENQINIAFKTLARMKLEKRNVPQSGHFEIMMREKPLVVRVASIPTRVSERFILRIMDWRKLIRKIEEMGFSSHNFELINKMLNYRQGLILVSGPSGSGMSTTLYSLIKHFQNPELNIFTIEDPIEAPLPGINQVEINERVGLEPEECLKNVLMHAPDALMISRVKTPSMAHRVVEASLTGRLVIAGLYARNVINAITRLRDFGIEPYLLSSPLVGVMSQRLARALCPDCSEEVELSPDLKWELEVHNVKTPYKIKAGRGCSRCLHTGFRGRLGIYEILPVSDAFRSMIMRGSSKTRLQEQASRDGFKTLYQDGLEKVARGLTTYEEIKRVLID